MNTELTPQERNLFINCIAIYGLPAQLEQLIEECLECALAARKYMRASQSLAVTPSNIDEARNHLLEELVDISIMAEQIKRGFSKHSQMIDVIHTAKIERQIKRLENLTNPLIQNEQ